MADALPQPRDEREFKAELELSSGAILPGGKIALTFRRLWDQRVERLAEEIADQAGVDDEDFVKRLEAGDGFADLFRTAAERVVADGDPSVRDMLSRLVAAALLDDARIHEASYFMKLLGQLDPIHIRILWFVPSEATAEAQTAAGVGGDSRSSSERQITNAVNASPLLMSIAFTELMRQDLIKRPTSIAHHWVLNTLGLALRELVGEIHGENLQSRR